MNIFVRLLFSIMILGGVLAASPDAVYAYGGPGSVISGIGAFLALIAALLASLFGFIWFPLKRLYQKMTGSSEEPSPAATESSGQ